MVKTKDGEVFSKTINIRPYQTIDWELSDIRDSSK